MNTIVETVVKFVCLVLALTAGNLIFDYRRELWHALKHKMKRKHDITEQM